LGRAKDHQSADPPRSIFRGWGPVSGRLLGFFTFDWPFWNHFHRTRSDPRVPPQNPHHKLAAFSQIERYCPRAVSAEWGDFGAYFIPSSHIIPHNPTAFYQQPEFSVPPSRFLEDPVGGVHRSFPAPSTEVRDAFCRTLLALKQLVDRARFFVCLDRLVSLGLSFSIYSVPLRENSDVLSLSGLWYTNLAIVFTSFTLPRFSSMADHLTLDRSELVLFLSLHGEVPRPRPPF